MTPTHVSLSMRTQTVGVRLCTTYMQQFPCENSTLPPHTQKPALVKQNNFNRLEIWPKLITCFIYHNIKGKKKTTTNQKPHSTYTVKPVRNACL